MPDECRRHDMQETGYRTVRVARGNGRSLPKWATYIAAKCSKCDAIGHKLLAEVRAHDEREGARLNGVPAADLPPAAPSSNTPAIAARMAAWPFPVSGHNWNRGEKNGS